MYHGFSKTCPSVQSSPHLGLRLRVQRHRYWIIWPGLRWQRWLGGWHWINFCCPHWWIIGCGGLWWPYGIHKWWWRWSRSGFNGLYPWRTWFAASSWRAGSSTWFHGTCHRWTVFKFQPTRLTSTSWWWVWWGDGTSTFTTFWIRVWVWQVPTWGQSHSLWVGTQITSKEVQKQGGRDQQVVALVANLKKERTALILSRCWGSFLIRLILSREGAISSFLPISKLYQTSFLDSPGSQDREAGNYEEDITSMLSPSLMTACPMEKPRWTPFQCLTC